MTPHRRDLLIRASCSFVLVVLLAAAGLSSACAPAHGGTDAGGGAGAAEEIAPRFEGDPYEHALAKVVERMPEGFHAVIEKPFVVVGDGGRGTVSRWAEGTVRWATTLLKKDYFAKDPETIVEVWLFKDRASYTKHTRELFGDSPTTPFGYYSPRHQALIMNIDTGGGTLVHEIVHPFMAANFPGCPAWLNEGMGSLYEACHERDGKIMGLTNWRLTGLHKAIDEERTVDLEWLVRTSDRDFYGEGSGLHYAQARYLCFWLQEKGLLRPFFRRFHSGVDEDGTGLKSLRKVLERDDLDAFQAEWETWCRQLRHG